MSFAKARLEAGRSITALFEETPQRFEEFSAQLGDILFDYSRTSMTSPAREALFDKLRSRGWAGRRDAMFAGARINGTEDRQVLHTALRMDPGEAPFPSDVARDVQASRAACFAFAEDVRAGRYTAAEGAFTDVVNIGIGGSDLGPVLVAEALKLHADGPRMHFVSNVDGADLIDVIAACDLKRTLFVIASKSFSTIETLETAKVAQAALAQAVAEPARHFAALTSKPQAAAEQFGIPPERCFGFGDYVGGRYSVWSPIGLPLMIGLGPETFSAFLDGAHTADRHFLTAPMAENLPVLMATVGVWHRNICGYGTRAVVPYDQRMRLLPQYLQQLDMESNGKRVSRDGNPVPVATSPVVWGSAGSNAQHAYFQMLHQSNDVQPVEFLVGANGHSEGVDQLQSILLANCLAQAQAFASGRTQDEAFALMQADGVPEAEARALAPHRTFPGNRPSTLTLYRQLDPRTLGTLIALAEHRTFIEGVYWDLNSFDQWGVELGKVLAKDMQPFVEGETAGVDPMMAGALNALQRLKG
ncbi:MAG: glucose-6-phosphate isomerase [Pseudomonadota bacterium]